MIGEGIQEEVLRALVDQHAVRECRVAKVDGGPYWGLSVRSRREPRRTWASSTAAGRFAEAVGLSGFVWSCDWPAECGDVPERGVVRYGCLFSRYSICE